MQQTSSSCLVPSKFFVCLTWLAIKQGSAVACFFLARFWLYKTTRLLPSEWQG